MNRSITLMVMVVACHLTTRAFTARADERDDFFESKIRPVLSGTCFRCHGDSKTAGGLRVDSREMLLKGGESGPAIVPGQPETSLLIKAIRREADVSAMPPEKEKSLRADQIADFVRWIKSGAAWPANSRKFEATKHWAFEPVQDASPPEVRQKSWVRTSIDPFILAKQEAAGGQPAPRADKRTLIRRATFDLTGLPPTPEEVLAFEQDASPNAFETVIERLLKSPAYGERWGRHWLDVVRYADTAGETADYPVPLAWHYRNYVIDAFNHDKPYDDFLREQIAGDVLASLSGTALAAGVPDVSEQPTAASALPLKKIESDGQTPPNPTKPTRRDRYAEQVTATGFLAISRRFGFDSENYHHLTIQDTIDTLGQTVLGLSLGCARCHDHKFDAVSMNDYYALYGIFDSSRYAFPGSEQKQKVRAMLPLTPPKESMPKWRDFDARVAQLAANLERHKQPVPAVTLRSMHELDGDFELQAPAAGGSNGVLVPPWLYRGRIAVTNAAQSPFKNLYPRGRVGASIASGAGDYRIEQAIHPRRSAAESRTLSVNLDVRVATPDAATTGLHRFWIGAVPEQPAVELLISSEAILLRSGETTERLAALKPNQWHNVQLVMDLANRTVSGRIGMPGQVAEFSNKPLATNWPGSIELVVLDSVNQADARQPAIEFDNLGVQELPIAPVSTELPLRDASDNATDPTAMTKELQELTGLDGDFELQTKETAPTSPWNPGPNSVVKVSTRSQSPFQNIYSAGELGIHMPNRGEYDGFGLTFGPAKPNDEGMLFAAFDFRCASSDAGGSGSWRYYLGHGPGSSAAVELFFNGSEFFRRSANAREPVCPLVVGEWYQVQLSLDLKGKSYSGRLNSRDGSAAKEFSGQLASGWDGTIDYSFIDSYGHIGGVRPSLDADNFMIGDKPAPPSNASPLKITREAAESRRARIAELRKRLASQQAGVELAKQELNQLLASGPFKMTYGVSEGTPHNVRMQMRGEPDQPGIEVPRGFIRALGGQPLPAETRGSGRKELADWLTRPENPLTARVMANRIWQYHFGRGLVRTPNDFGVRGQPPTHPELLDFLATQFVKHGWSIKSMHRLIMLSATYQQASDVFTNATANEQASQPRTNPDLYVGFVRRRLSAEEIRDSILAVSGELDPVPGREHPFPSPIGWGFSQHGPFNAVYDHNKRSVYLMTQRLKRHPFLALFDGADPNATTAERLGTTVPTQALFFLNDPFVHAKAERWAQRLQSTSDDEPTRLTNAWLRAVGRRPEATELTEASEFLAAYRAELASSKLDSTDTRALAALLRSLIGSNEFLHVD